MSTADLFGMNLSNCQNREQIQDIKIQETVILNQMLQIKTLNYQKKKKIDLFKCKILNHRRRLKSANSHKEGSWTYIIFRIPSMEKLMKRPSRLRIQIRISFSWSYIHGVRNKNRILEILNRNKPVLYLQIEKQIDEVKEIRNKYFGEHKSICIC